MFALPSATIVPHSGVGGLIPIPRKPSAEASRIDQPRTSEPRTMAGATEFGKTCRYATRQGGFPTTRAASAYSASRSFRTSPRVSRTK
jgi:hypothetical protein